MLNIFNIHSRKEYNLRHKQRIDNYDLEAKPPNSQGQLTSDAGTERLGGLLGWAEWPELGLLLRSPAVRASRGKSGPLCLEAKREREFKRNSFYFLLFRGRAFSFIESCPKKERQAF
jgi:hypothetical protein